MKIKLIEKCAQSVRLGMVKDLMLFSGALLLLSCIEIIDFEIGETDAELIIYGQINNSQAYDQRIRVSRTTNSNRPPINVESAAVTVLDENDNIFQYRFDEATGYYLPMVPFIGSPGVAYQLRVSVDNRVYVSNFQRMPLRTAIDSTYYEFERRETISASGVDFQQWFVRILTDTEIISGPEPLYIKRDVLQTYLQQEMSLPQNVFPFYAPGNCWISDLWIGTNILLFDGNLVSATTVPGQLVSEVPLDNSFRALRGFGVVQSSFSREALAYWTKVDEVSNRTGSLFEVPPAPIPGNIRNEEDQEEMALGFFEVAKVDTSGTVITGSDIPVFLGFNGNFANCNFISQNTLQRLPFNCFSCLRDLGIDEACYNCEVLQNSSRIKPTYLE